MNKPITLSSKLWAYHTARMIRAADMILTSDSSQGLLFLVDLIDHVKEKTQSRMSETLGWVLLIQANKKHLYSCICVRLIHTGS